MIGATSDRQKGSGRHSGEALLNNGQNLPEQGKISEGAYKNEEWQRVRDGC